MAQFSRRTFLAGSAAAPLLPDAADRHRNPLTSEAVPADARAALRQSGEKQLKTS